MNTNYILEQKPEYLLNTKVTFKDDTDTTYIIYCRINLKGRVQFVGDHGYGWGQIRQCIFPKTDAQNELLCLWKLYHLKIVPQTRLNTFVCHVRQTIEDIKREDN